MDIIRRGTDCGIRALLQLASRDGAVTPCQTIAEAGGTPKSFTHKILRKLTDARLLASHEGRPGGFSLRKNPENITLYEIVKVLQGPPTVSRCLVNSPACDRRKICVLSTEWSKLQHSLVSFLKSRSLADMLTSSGLVRDLRSMKAKS